MKTRKAELADFAERLFGEPFAGGNAVVMSRRLRHPKLARSHESSGLSPTQWSAARKMAAFVHECDLAGRSVSAEEWNSECDLEGLKPLQVDSRS